MLLPGCHISRTYIFITVFATAIFADPSPEDEKTFNLKIGFDLTHGENGAPALRIRDFEDSNEFNPRAAEDDSDKSKETGKAVGKNADPIPKKAILRSGGKSTSSESDSGENRNEGKNKKASSSEEVKQKHKDAHAEKESDKSDSLGSGGSDEDAKRSTRGLGNFEPEDQYPKTHGRQDNDDDDRRRRRKRSPEERFQNRKVAEKFIAYYSEKYTDKLKRKSKKVNKLPKEARITSYKPF